MFSFAVLTHNESLDYLQKCIGNILAAMHDDDELVIVDDFSTNQETIDYLNRLSTHPAKIQIYQHALNKDFAQQKNFLISKCSNDWIFNLDADEYMTVDTINWYRQLIVQNTTLQAVCMPRKNIVLGMSDKDAEKFNFALSYR